MAARRTRDLTGAALLLAVGVIVQAVEAIYLPPLMIPGAKLGLANSVTLVVIALYRPKDALVHVGLRTTIVSLVTGTFLSTTYLYSILGGLLSATVMIAAHRFLYGKLSYIGISVCGALTHNLTQLGLSIFILGHIGIISLLPWLIFVALLTGLANGAVVNSVGPRLVAVRAAFY